MHNFDTHAYSVSDFLPRLGVSARQAGSGLSALLQCEHPGKHAWAETMNDENQELINQSNCPITDILSLSLAVSPFLLHDPNDYMNINFIIYIYIYTQ